MSSHGQYLHEISLICLFGKYFHLKKMLSSQELSIKHIDKYIKNP